MCSFTYQHWWSSERGEIDLAYEVLISFEFFFILDLMKDFVEITNLLYQDLQCQSQDSFF